MKKKKLAPEKRFSLFKAFQLVCAFNIALLIGPAYGQPAGCLSAVKKAEIARASRAAERVVLELESFAKEHALPTLILPLGPPERPMERFFVAIDSTDEALMQAYRERFDMHRAFGEGHGGTLPIEFETEFPNQGYVTAILRHSPKTDDRIWRYGNQTQGPMLWKDWWTQLIINYNGKKDRPVLGFSHLIGLSEAEMANVQHYLYNPADRGPCKNANCVSWLSNIELGKTAKDVPENERGYLFTMLGMQRASAHFEIGRRLMLAANERNSGIAVFVNGKAGYGVFTEEFAKHLPPAPKMPYANILKAFKANENAALIKAIGEIPDGAKVFVPIAAGASPEGLTQLMARAAKSQNGFDVHMLINGVSEGALRKGIDESEGKFRIHALFLGSNLRALHEEGKVRLVPGYLSDFSRLVRNPETPDFHYDAMIVRVSPPDEQGHYSLGPNSDMIGAILRDRPNIKVIAEINENIPNTLGKNFLVKEQITASFTSKAQLANAVNVPLTDVEKQIGTHLSKLIHNGATLQIGIGNIFGGLPAAMKTEGRTGIHAWTEMLGDQMKEMVDDGIIDKVDASFAFGSDGLYKWLHKNPKIQLQDVELINNPGYIASKKGFIAVNTGLQVNLRGDVNATIKPDGGRLSSPGGQVEFMSGAARSEGGKAIIAIRSTAKAGTISSITLDLYQGPVTTPHESVTHVVTEYGVATLVGKSESKRAMALIQIAHPNFRKGLAEEAFRKKLISAGELASLQ